MHQMMLIMIDINSISTGIFLSLLFYEVHQLIMLCTSLIFHWRRLLLCVTYFLLEKTKKNIIMICKLVSRGNFFYRWIIYKKCAFLPMPYFFFLMTDWKLNKSDRLDLFFTFYQNLIFHMSISLFKPIIGFLCPCRSFLPREKIVFKRCLFVGFDSKPVYHSFGQPQQRG